MCKRFRSLLRSKKGISGTVSAVFGILIAAFLMVAGINVCHAINEYSLLNDFANQLKQTAADEGCTDCNKLDNRYQELCDSCGIVPTSCTFTANYFDSSEKKVQYGDTITVTMTLDTEMDFCELPLHFTIEKTAKSQQYWK